MQNNNQESRMSDNDFATRKRHLHIRAHKFKRIQAMLSQINNDEYAAQKLKFIEMLIEKQSNKRAIN